MTQQTEPLVDFPPPLEEAGLDWEAAVEVYYMIRQKLRYSYPGPIGDLRHRLVIVPRARHGDQQRVAHSLAISPSLPARVVRDRFGNSVVTVRAPHIVDALTFELRSVVRRSARATAHRIGEGALRDPALLDPTLLTRPDEALCALADSLRRQHPDPIDLAEAINLSVHAEMRYVAEATTVKTSAAQAFASRSGVCQDFAHVALALARRCGIAARYVSGHLIGAGGTHAWIELLVPENGTARVLALDPTHGRRITMKYVVVAVGRDYGDVAPTSGVFSAPYAGELATQRLVAATAVRYAA
jgi:transglutaminase-like putative cysteine protease